MNTASAPSTDRGRSQLDQGSLATAITVGLNAVGGLAFWFIAARRFDATGVGQALGLFQALLFVHYLTQLGLPVAIGHFAHGRNRRAAQISNFAVDVRLIATLVVGTLFLILTWRSEFVEPLRTWNPSVGVLLFVLLAMGAGAGTLAEMRLVTLRSWRWMVARIALPMALRIPAILLLGAAAAGFDIFLVAATPIATAGVIAAVGLRLTVDRVPRWSPRSDPKSAEVARYATTNWASMLATEGPIFAAPVIVAASVSAADNAPFLVAWNVSALTFVLPYMISQVLLSESRPGTDLAAAARHAYLVAQTLTSTITVFAWLGAGLIANVYGPEYGDIKSQLPILVGANIAWVATTISLSVARAQEQSRHVLTIGTIFAATTLIPTLIFAPRGGTTAAGLAWFFGNCITGLVAVWLQRDVWRRRPAER